MWVEVDGRVDPHLQDSQSLAIMIWTTYNSIPICEVGHILIDHFVFKRFTLVVMDQD